MANSSASINSGSIGYPQVRNEKCFCGRRARVKISESPKNPNRLYFTCCSDEGGTRGCQFFKWLVLFGTDGTIKTPITNYNAEGEEEIAKMKQSMAEIKSDVKTYKLLLAGMLGLLFIILVGMVSGR